MKICNKCNLEKQVAEFSSNKSRKDGLQASCRSCMKEYKANHYNSNKEKVMAGNVRRRQEVMDKLWAYKQGKSCADCPITNPLVLEFDHLSDKTKGISEMVRDGHSWSSILTEISKCEIVCANCHRVRTATRGGWVRNITVKA